MNDLAGMIAVADSLYNEGIDRDRIRAEIAWQRASSKKPKRRPKKERAKRKVCKQSKRRNRK